MGGGGRVGVGWAVANAGGVGRGGGGRGEGVGERMAGGRVAAGYEGEGEYLGKDEGTQAEVWAETLNAR